MLSSRRFAPTNASIIFQEKGSGAQADRRELLKLLMKNMAAGDVVTVTRIGRLAARPPTCSRSSNAS
jgi:DNA invertase Pin-like site-specific DNA recombinase